MEKKRKLMKVSPEDFDVAALLQAAREGRLYIAVEDDPTTLPEECRQEIFEYVARIGHCGNGFTADQLNGLWQQLLAEPMLMPYFRMSNGKMRGKVNYYRVNLVVYMLRDNGLYDSDRYSTLQLHLIMEQKPHKSSFYTSRNNYNFPLKERQRLISIIKQFKKLQGV